jgi:predicted RNase H-like HicB family nuclease
MLLTIDCLDVERREYSNRDEMGKADRIHQILPYIVALVVDIYDCRYIGFRGFLSAEPKEVAMNIKIVLETGEDGYYVAHVPALKSCWSQGKTREEALRNIREAIDLYLEPEPEELKNREVVELVV